MIKMNGKQNPKAFDFAGFTARAFARAFTLAAFAFLTFLALVAFSAQANAKLEPAALIEFTFGVNETNGETILSLTDFKTGLSEVPYYPVPAKNDLQVRLLDREGRSLKAFWLSDPRYAYYDAVGADGTLSGGSEFKPNAEFFIIVPLLENAAYAAVFDSQNKKLAAVDLLTGKQAEEKNWVSVEPSFEEKRELGVVEFAVAIAALLILAFVALGLTVFNKARKR
jgi:hypothetical protein